MYKEAKRPGITEKIIYLSLAFEWTYKVVSP